MRFPILTAVLLFIVIAASGQQLGQTKEAISPSTAASNISPPGSSQDRPLPATSRSAPSSLGNAPEGLVTLLFVVCLVALLLKLIPPLLLARGRRIAVGPVKGPPSSTPRVANRPPLQRKASPALALTLEDIGWENFELLSGEIFRRQGFEVEISSGLGADGGKDLTLRRDGEVRLVQCKLLSAENKVSVLAMREFYGLLMAENAKCGIFMTTGLYSRDAREFAEGKPIELLGRVEIEQLMASVAHPGENLCIIRNWINDFVAVAHVTDPVCPRCRKPMKLRRAATGRMFWGCSSFPRCRGKRDVQTELVRAHSCQQS